VIAPRSSLALLAVVAVAVLAGCQTTAAIGNSCARDSECSTPLVCRHGRCRNACTANRDCPVGSQCFLDRSGLGACQLDQDRSCTSSCPDGLTCLSSGCVRVCAMPSECPSDGTCTLGSGSAIGICTDARDASDAGPRDAGPGDGAIDAATDAGPACAAIAHACAGHHFACAVTDGDHAVHCWGSDTQGQSGAMPTGELCSGAPCRLHPSRVVDDMGQPIALESLTCGEAHACGVTAAGAVLCWGADGNAERGDGLGSWVPFATRARYDSGTAWGTATAPRASMVRAGRSHSCALSVDRMQVRCWGTNAHGELGDGTTGASGRFAVAPTALTSAIAGPYADLVLGAGWTCLVDDMHHLRCVGTSSEGQLGADVAIGTDTLAAVDPHMPSAAVSFVAGAQHLCARDAMGTVSCIGHNVRQELGRTTVPDRSSSTIPAPVDGAIAFDAIGSSPNAATTFGTSGAMVYAWGDNYLAAAALDPMNPIRAAPERVAGLSSVAELAIGSDMGCAVTTAHALSCWGSDESAQLGRGIDGPVLATPTVVCVE
jgi:alpha-tubulin suppressor-like RCC1 family protein